MALVPIDENSLLTQSRILFKYIIDHYVVDPKVGRIPSNRRWIYREFPDLTQHPKPTLPFIVLSPPDFNREILTLDNCSGEHEFTINISFYAEFSDIDARVDELSDKFIFALRQNDVLDFFQEKNIDSINLENVSYDNPTVNNMKLSERMITLSYKVII